MDVYLNGVLDNGALVGTVTSSQQNSTSNVNIGQRAQRRVRLQRPDRRRADLQPGADGRRDPGRHEHVARWFLVVGPESSDRRDHGAVQQRPGQRHRHRHRGRDRRRRRERRAVLRRRRRDRRGRHRRALRALVGHPYRDQRSAHAHGTRSRRGRQHTNVRAGGRERREHELLSERGARHRLQLCRRP